MADYKELFAERLKHLRSERGLTQAKLAELLGSKPRTMKNWEGGVNIPPVEILCKIADYFVVSLDYLVGRDKP